MSWQDELLSLQGSLTALEEAADKTKNADYRRFLLDEAEHYREMIRNTGPYIPDSPGASRPHHMDNEEWAEYKMTPEYAHEVSYEPDEPYMMDDFYDY